MTNKDKTHFAAAIITAAIEAAQQAEQMFRTGLYTADEKDREAAEIVKTAAELVRTL